MTPGRERRRTHTSLHTHGTCVRVCVQRCHSVCVCVCEQQCVCVCVAMCVCVGGVESQHQHLCMCVTPNIWQKHKLILPDMSLEEWQEPERLYATGELLIHN